MLMLIGGSIVMYSIDIALQHAVGWRCLWLECQRVVVSKGLEVLPGLIGIGAGLQRVRLEEALECQTLVGIDIEAVFDLVDRTLIEWLAVANHGPAIDLSIVEYAVLVLVEATENLGLV
jgi:hypothetical protein